MGQETLLQFQPTRLAYPMLNTVFFKVLSPTEGNRLFAIEY